jgi:hypothetical protein
MKKAGRKKIHEKYNKHCAYCGKTIKYEEMQVDHIIPKKLGGNDNFENLNPSCRRCNHYKRALSIEKFRTVWLGKLHERLENIYIVKVALDYGIIPEIKPFDGRFYFEDVVKRNNRQWRVM